MLASSGERLLFETRRHTIVLVAAFAKATLLCAGGLLLLRLDWLESLPAVVLLVIAAWIAVRAVVTWDRTQLFVSDQKLWVAAGVLRRQRASVRLAQTGPVEVEQTLIGRVLGYGTVIAGDLEIDYIPDPDGLFEALGQVDE